MGQIKPVYFSDTRDRDALQIADSLPNFSDWVKGKLRADICAGKGGAVDPEIEKVINLLFEAKIGKMFSREKGGWNE